LKKYGVYRGPPFSVLQEEFLQRRKRRPGSFTGGENTGEEHNEEYFQFSGRDLFTLGT